MCLPSARERAFVVSVPLACFPLLDSLDFLQLMTDVKFTNDEDGDDAMKCISRTGSFCYKVRRE